LTLLRLLPIKGMPENRAPRVQEFAIENARFIIEHKDFPVLNLSATGLGIALPITENIPEDKPFSGIIDHDNRRFSVTLSVIRREPRQTGLHIIEGGEDIDIYLRSKYSAEINAQQMVHVNPSTLQQQQDGQPHWLFDGHKSQLYFIESNGIVGRFKISWQEHNFSRDIHGRVHYEKNGKPGQASREDISAIIRFLGHIENLENSFLGQIASSLRKGV